MEAKRWEMGEWMDMMRTSLALKVIVLGIILLVLMIPLVMTSSLREERQRRACEASEEVSRHWGGQAYLMAPVLSMPFTQEQKVDGATRTVSSTFFLRPETMKIECEVEPEIRYRGIYQVVLYKAKALLTGQFVIPACKAEQAEKWLVKENTLDFYFEDTKGVTRLEAVVDGKPLKIKNAGTEIFSFALTDDVSETVEKTVEFRAEIDFNGHEQLMFSPNASDFELNVKSSWQHPSFCGAVLPTSRNISETGFEASWRLGATTMRRHPQSWCGGELVKCGQTRDEYFGVALKLPADTYVQVDRVTNYAFLVMAIVLIAFLIGEILTKIWVHPFQYFFVGLSLVMFYTLLLALAEHVNFNLSYAISAVVISGMVTAYGRMIFAEKNASAFVLGGIILLAYALIFILTRLEDYALLAGCVIMLALLGVLMAFTGHLNRPAPEPPKAMLVEDRK